MVNPPNADHNLARQSVDRKTVTRKLASMPHLGATAPRNVRIRRVLISILVANAAVVVAKLVIGLRTGSLGVLGDAAHSSVDAMNNVLALVVVGVAARAPDEDHPYGHQKFETLGALAIVGFLSITAFELVKGAIQRLVVGAPSLSVTPLQFGFLLATLLVNVVVASYETKQGKQLGSEILLADATHTRADVFITIGVLSGVMLARLGVNWADSVVALAVAVVIVALAYGIVASSIPVLVDQHVVPSEIIRMSAESVSGVSSAYDIRSRGSNYRTFAEITIAVKRGTTVEDGHEIADAVERQLRSQLQLHQIIVHVEPC